MSLADAALEVGEFLLKHLDIVQDVAEALASGTPKEAIRAAIRGAMNQVSRDALEEEFAAAEARK